MESDCGDVLKSYSGHVLQALTDGIWRRRDSTNKLVLPLMDMLHTPAKRMVQVMYYHHYGHALGHPAQIPPPQPQQLATPTPNVRRTSETTLTTPSPSTNPLAMTIRRISAPPVFATLRWYQYSINPPTKRANENDGVFKNPIANATPDGIHLAYGRPRWTAKSLMPATTENRRANSNMKGLVFSGSCPFPVTPHINSKTAGDEL